MSGAEGKKLVLLGSQGMLGQMVLTLAPSNYNIVPLDRSQLNLARLDEIAPFLKSLSPDIILNCAAYTAVDRCEEAEEDAFLLNAQLPGTLAAVAKSIGARLVHISTDYVFDGKGTVPYCEEDPVGPLSVYGRSKLEGEQQIENSGLDDWLIIRTSWLYGPCGKNFADTILKLAKERTALSVVDDQVGSPTFTGDLADAIFCLLETDAKGMFHFSSDGSCSWYGFACALIEGEKCAGGDLTIESIQPIDTGGYPLPATRPAYSVLSKERYQEVTGAVVPHWRDGLARFFECRKNENLNSGEKCSQ